MIKYAVWILYFNILPNKYSKMLVISFSFLFKTLKVCWEGGGGILMFDLRQGRS
jgi:hypothetical protein